MDGSQERIRIKDIAEQAGVSVGTVDRVLHGRPNVSESARIKVEEVLKRINYQPNMYASALASNKRYRYVCLIPEHGPSSYWIEVEEGLHQGVAWMKDFNVAITLLHYNPFDASSYSDQCDKALSLEPDGVILAPKYPDTTKNFTDALSQNGIPYIFIDSTIENLNPLAYYGQDSQQSGFFAARMLMLLSGGRKEVFLFKLIDAGRLASRQQEDREAGFRQYMKENHPDCNIIELCLDARHPEHDEKSLDGFFSQHHDIQGITFSSKAYIIGEYLTRKNRTDVQIMGYDLLQRNKECLNSLTVSFLITQHPWQQAFNCIKTLSDHLILKKEVRKVNLMPIELISVENLAFYSRTHL